MTIQNGKLEFLLASIRFYKNPKTIGARGGYYLEGLFAGRSCKFYMRERPLIEGYEGGELVLDRPISVVGEFEPYSFKGEVIWDLKTLLALD